MSAKNKFLSRKIFFSLIIMLFLVLFAFFIIDGYLNLDRDVKIYTTNAKGMIDLRMKALFFEINNILRDIGDDLLFLSKMSSLGDIVKSEGESRDTAIKNLEEDFLKFLEGESIYYQSRYIDEDGNEVVRAEFDGNNNYKIVPKDELQNKRERYYFTETVNLDEGEIYLSRLDLNIEGGRIENRGTEENPEYIPVIRIATPIYAGEVQKGIILFNIYADYFLDDVRKSQREGEFVFLIDKQGYYLAHPDREKEFAFMFEERNDNFYKDYPQIPREVLFDFSKRSFESEDLIFSFNYLYPTMGNYEIHKGSEKVFSDEPEKDYFWIMAIVSEKEDTNMALESLKRNYYFSVLFSVTLVLIIVFLVFMVTFKIPNSKDGAGK